jgi:hypothetical protein
MCEHIGFHAIRSKLLAIIADSSPIVSNNQMTRTRLRIRTDLNSAAFLIFAALGLLPVYVLGLLPQSASANTGTRTVDLRLVPENRKVWTDSEFDLQIKVEPNGQSTTGVQVFVNFDQSLVSVLALNIDPDSPLSVPLLKSFDNRLGTVDLVAGTFDVPATEPFILGTITFTSLAVTAETKFEFSSASPRKTVASISGEEIQRYLFGADLTIQGTGDISTPSPSPTLTPTATPILTPTATPVVSPTPTQTPTPVPILQSVLVRLVAEPALIEPGKIGSIGVYVEPTQAQMTGVQIFADFDPTRIKILSMEMELGSPFEAALTEAFDNVFGTLDVSAGTLGQSVGSSFKLFTIRYRAMQISGPTEVVLSRVFPRNTLASVAGDSLLTLTRDALISIHRPPVVDLLLLPESLEIGLAHDFELNILVKPNGETVTDVQVFLDFDPQALQVLSVAPVASSPLARVLVNTIDNEIGQLDFAAGSLVNGATTSFTLARITARTRKSGVVTKMDFSSQKPRVTTASVGGDAVQRGLFGASIAIRTPQKVPSMSTAGLMLLMFGFVASLYRFRIRAKNQV